MDNPKPVGSPEAAKIADLETRVSKLEGPQKGSISYSDPTDWKKTSEGKQFEYLSAQIIKSDLDGLAFTDDGISFLGVQVLKTPWKDVLQKQIDKGFLKISSSLTGKAAKIFESFMPDSALQARTDERQDAAIRLLLGEENSRVTSSLDRANAGRTQTANSRALTRNGRRQRAAAVESYDRQISGIQELKTRIEALQHQIG
jgi:hypothetical protein